MFEEYSGIACFPKSARALIIFSIITLSLFITVFLFWHISCSPWSTASVLRSDFWVLGVIPQAGVGRTLPWCQPKINWYLLDETPSTHLPARPTLFGVWNLFVSYSSFIHSAYRFHSTHMLWDVVSGCAGRWMPSVGFLLAVYRLDVFEANSLYLQLIVASQVQISVRAKQHLYLELFFFLAHSLSFFHDWNVRHLFSFSVLLFSSASVQILVASFITWPQNPTKFYWRRSSGRSKSFLVSVRAINRSLSWKSVARMVCL